LILANIALVIDDKNMNLRLKSLTDSFLVDVEARAHKPLIGHNASKHAKGKGPWHRVLPPCLAVFQTAKTVLHLKNAFGDKLSPEPVSARTPI